MHEQELAQTLARMPLANAPPGMYERIMKQVSRRGLRRRLWATGITLLALCFGFLTFLPGGGAAADKLRQVLPTLYLRTNLGQARRILYSPIRLPATFTREDGTEVVLGPDTPTAIGRWGPYETINLMITEPGPVLDGTVLEAPVFQLSRSTHPGLRDDRVLRSHYPPDAIIEPVQVGEHDGFLVMYDGGPKQLVWRSATHTYMLSADVTTAADLVQLATAIR